jgi:hypothetical protein
MEGDADLAGLSLDCGGETTPTSLLVSHEPPLSPFLQRCYRTMVAHIAADVQHGDPCREGMTEYTAVIEEC